ncbi:MAG: flagellar basal body P-ring formation chaperone FlgA [Phaeospirillum sp.]|nr:flagellar basal body P-ring formation chaperone FlgA [Phaeospirillum sp.]
MTRRFARTSFASLAFAAALALGSAAAWAEQLPAQLKSSVSLEGDVIRLGDLWENIGGKADTPLANAPQPGKRITLETRWLAAVAQSYGIDWRPANAFERTVVERVGQTVDHRVIETELREALRLEGAPANASIEIANRAGLQVVVPGNVAATVGIRDVIYDQRMNRFTAVVEVPAGAANATRVKVGGSVFASARIPVLAHPMARGDTITEADIQWVDVREEVLRRDIVTNIRQMIGQEPRYQLRAGAPVRTVELQKPVVVAKNTTVTMIVKTRFMSLTAQGRAVEDGSTGDVIRVTNIHSKQTVDARVDGPGQVSVTPGGMRALAN